MSCDEIPLTEAGQTSRSITFEKVDAYALDNAIKISFRRHATLYSQTYAPTMELFQIERMA